jgi:hypothetical protein
MKYFKGKNVLCPTVLLLLLGMVKEGADCPKFEFRILTRLVCSIEPEKIKFWFSDNVGL